ncbi:hypothetical protein OJAV_G00162070 [Oryzias javanicus]|uniref:Apolipoprotein A-IV n=1 Tax=Oryzias javanicus TaxID=123683 RepID=A0A437CKC0_ORYJA|nr:hypothetical protein OJAV_G00162070 [Oryzias javanicus]
MLLTFGTIFQWRYKRVRQGDNKTQPFGLCHHCSFAAYISCRVSSAQHKHNQVDLQTHLQSKGVGVMKVLAVLVLAVFTGCNANLFYADAPKPQLEVLTDAFWDYVSKATQTADDTLEMIKKTQFGQEVSARLTESATLANEYATSIHEQLPPEAKQLITKVTTEADVLRERVNQELTKARENLEPYAENLRSQIEQRVEQLKQELAPYTESLDSETLRATLMQKSEELKANLEQSVQDLQTQLGPYTEDLKQKVDQHLQDFKERVAPISVRVQSEIGQRAQQVKEMASPYVEQMRERLDPYAQDLQARLTSLYDSFVKSN